MFLWKTTLKQNLQAAASHVRPTAGYEIRQKSATVLPDGPDDLTVTAGAGKSDSNDKS